MEMITPLGLHHLRKIRNKEITMKIIKYLKLGKVLNCEDINGLEDGTVVFYVHRSSSMDEYVKYARELAVKRKSVLQTPFGNLIKRVYDVYREEYEDAIVYEVID